MRRRTRALLQLVFQVVALWALLWGQLNIAHSQVPEGNLFRRISRASNFEFALFNNGMLYGMNSLDLNWKFDPYGHWPRGSFRLSSDTYYGPVLLAKKGTRLLTTSDGFWVVMSPQHEPFDQMVPGRIGDPKAPTVPAFNGPGWGYVDDPDYVVYSSLDYDSNGIDRSGNNFNDWPIRWVNDTKTYVPDPQERARYKPAFVSDEDMFSTSKDTDPRADPHYTGPNGPSIPIGIEMHNYVYSWGSGPGKDIVLFEYQFLNKSGAALDSCYFLFGGGLDWIQGDASVKRRIGVLKGAYHDTPFMTPNPLRQPNSAWTATAVPPTFGFPLMQTPAGYTGRAVGLTRAARADTITWYLDSTWTYQSLATANDSIQYRKFVNPEFPFHSTSPIDVPLCPLLLSGPFPLAAGDTAKYVVGIIFSDSIPHLQLLDEYITRVFQSGFKNPSPPPPPHLTARGLNRSVRLSWDNMAESATDLIIPDSLGRPFVGYKLLRSQTQEGPYVEVGRWYKDSLLVHEYLDRGLDLPGGLKNNVQYYYRLLSFDEGAPRLKLDTMTSPSVEGVNSVSVVPGVEPSNATSSSSTGNVLSGTLGDVSSISLIPTNTTNFNNLVSGRALSLMINASTDGIRYTLPVTIRDTISGRVQNSIIDPSLFVHGSVSTAGVKQGTGLIRDIFGVGAADVSVAYSFEQLPDSFHIVSGIVSTQGADVPIVVKDSLNQTGVLTITPYTTAARGVQLEFSPGGIDTISTLFKRYIPYLTVTVRDVSTGNLLEPDTDYTFIARCIKSTGGTAISGKPNRYYLSGTISNGETWDCGATLSMYQSKVGFDYTDHGVGSGKPTPSFSWGSTHRSGTKDFQAGDKVTLSWEGGVRAVFPRQATVRLQGAPGGTTDVTDAMLDAIRVVPNPYLIRHEAQRGSPVLYFNYLPEECTIRIYTIALDLVKTIHHSGGSREEWNLQTEGGQLVASQLLLAHIEATNGKKVVKKFAVVVGN